MKVIKKYLVEENGIKILSKTNKPQNYDKYWDISTLNEDNIEANEIIITDTIDPETKQITGYTVSINTDIRDARLAQETSSLTVQNLKDKYNKIDSKQKELLGTADIKINKAIDAGFLPQSYKEYRIAVRAINDPYKGFESDTSKQTLLENLNYDTISWPEVPWD